MAFKEDTGSVLADLTHGSSRLWKHYTAIFFSVCFCVKGVDQKQVCDWLIAFIEITHPPLQIDFSPTTVNGILFLSWFENQGLPQKSGGPNWKHPQSIPLTYSSLPDDITVFLAITWLTPKLTFIDLFLECRIMQNGIDFSDSLKSVKETLQLYIHQFL